MERNDDPTGMTLLEAIVALAILGIVFSVAPRLFIQMNRFYRQHIARVAVQQNARLALDAITRNLRQAQAESIVIDQIPGPPPQPPHSRITFARLQPSTTDTVAVSFYGVGHKLYQKVGPLDARVLAENLRYIAFSYPRTDDVRTISVSVTFERGTYEGSSEALQMAFERVHVIN